MTDDQASYGDQAGYGDQASYGEKKNSCLLYTSDAADE